MASDKHNIRKEEKQQPTNYQDLAEDREYNKGKSSRPKRRKRSNYKGKRDGAPYPMNANSPNWYTPNERLLKDVASLPFGRITGLPVRKENVMDGINGTIRVPGVLALNLMPTFGPTPTQVSTSPLNVASQTLFSYVRHANSGAANYESNDLMLYVLSVGNLISYYAHLCRIYGIATNFSVMNKYTPGALLTALHANATDVQNNLANFRAGINVLAYQIQKLIIPAGMTYIDRQVFIYESVFMDADTAKAQYYVYSPLGFYQYSEGTSDSASGMLTFKPLQSYGALKTANMTVEDLLQYGRELLNPILGSQDFNEIIAGDILKAFGSNVYKVPTISENYQVIPQYNKEVLMQIENCTAYNLTLEELLSGDYEMPTVEQNISVNSSTLVPKMALPLAEATTDATSFTARMNARLLWNEPMLNMHAESVTPEMVMVGSRLLSGFCTINGTVNDTNATYSIDVCGSEIVGNMTAYFYSYTGGVLQYQLATSVIASYNIVDVGTNPGIRAGGALTQAAVLMKFDWAPRCRWVCGDGKITDPLPGGTTLSDAFWDIENFTSLSKEELENLHTIAMMGMLNFRSIREYSPK